MDTHPEKLSWSQVFNIKFQGTKDNLWTFQRVMDPMLRKIRIRENYMSKNDAPQHHSSLSRSIYLTHHKQLLSVWHTDEA